METNLRKYLNKISKTMQGNVPDIILTFFFSNFEWVSSWYPWSSSTHSDNANFRQNIIDRCFLFWILVGYDVTKIFDIYWRLTHSTPAFYFYTPWKYQQTYLYNLVFTKYLILIWQTTTIFTIAVKCIVTLFTPVSHFYTSWKRQKSV